MAETPNRLRIEIAPKTIFLVLGVVAGVWFLGQLATVGSVVIIALVLVGTFDPLVAGSSDMACVEGVHSCSSSWSRLSRSRRSCC